MSKLITLNTTYDADTRVLHSTATTMGFATGLAAKIVTGEQITTVTVGEGPLLTDADYKNIQKSAILALNAMNIKLRDYVLASENLDEAKEIIAAETETPP